MILSYASRMLGTDPLPDENVEHVSQQLERLITGLRPRIVVGSAAAGTDLLVVEAALKSGVPVKVVVAGTQAEFRASFVAGHGPRWEAVFDNLPPEVGVVEVDLAGADAAAAYRAVKDEISRLSDAETEPDEPVVGLALASAGDTVDLAVAYDLRRRLVLRLDPTRRREDAGTAFVAMPYGERRDLNHGWRHYDADATYKRILLPALIDAGYRPVRADAEALLEVIDITMLTAINASEVLVADLATLNPNVMWELGVRHAWRDAGTVLLRPKGTKPPFDVSHARVHQYERDEKVVSDEQAIAGIRLLRDLLAEVPKGLVDSPVFAALPALAPTVLAGPEADVAPHEHIEAISLAADLQDAGALLVREQAVHDDPRLGAEARDRLLEQVGLALINVGSQTHAARVLRPLAERDTGMDRVRLQQQYAHALIRSDVQEGKLERLAQAEVRLRALLQRHPGSGETYGLLGSAAKARVELALATGQPVGDDLQLAIGAYLDGFSHDPGDYYPGIVALALIRLRGQRVAPNEADVARAKELLPVVRFAATRLGEPGNTDIWGVATVAELHLHDHFLNDSEAALILARALYAQVAALGRANQRTSAARQLRMMRDAGDPAGTINPLLALLDGG